MTRRSSVLAVLLNGRQVGRLSRAADGAIDFRYARDWLDWEHAMPVSLSLSLDTRRYTGAAVTAVFDNLLPDNDNIRRNAGTPVCRRVGVATQTVAMLAVAYVAWCSTNTLHLPVGRQEQTGPLRRHRRTGRPVPAVLGAVVRQGGERWHSPARLRR